MTEPATLYFNGHVLTMDGNNQVASAVLTVGERIVAVGTQDQVRAQCPVNVSEIDLKGRTMLPAFIDPHGHFPDSGFNRLFKADLAAPPLGDCRDLATVLERLRDKAGKTPAGEWVLGAMFDHNLLPERRMPTRDELDSVSTDHPIWVLHTTGHSGSANSRALIERGISDESSDPDNGRFGRDQDTGRLNGVLEGVSGMGELGATSFQNTGERFRQAFDEMRDEYLEHGITFAQNAWADRDQMEHFASYSAEYDPGIDILVLPLGELEPELTNGPDALNWPGNPHVTLGPRKLMTDGAVQLQTALLTKPYFKPLNSDTPCGISYVDPTDHKFQVKKLHKLGHQIHCHCNGDASADLFLDAVEEAQDAHPRDDHRHTIIHGQTMRDDQLERSARLGVTVSFFSAHVFFWGDSHNDTHLGPERANRISPAASAERLGVRYTIHNDAPVTHTRPIHLSHCAVNRLTASGRVLGKEQGVSVMSALRAQTIDAAWQVFQEDVRGSIEPGKLADLAILNRNPLEEPKNILETKVTTTVRRGQIVFDASGDPSID